jgi:hypothetical protein
MFECAAISDISIELLICQSWVYRLSNNWISRIFRHSNDRYSGTLMDGFPESPIIPQLEDSPRMGFQGFQ